MNKGTVLITGASRGIGKALAFEYARRGHQVALLAREAELLSENVEAIERLGGKAIALHCDVKDEEGMRSAIDTMLARFGAIDIAVLNAGIGNTMRINAFDGEIFEDILATNLLATMRNLAMISGVMKKQGGGVIAGVSSLADRRSIPGSSTYFASKAALTLMLEAASIELRPHHIHVVTVRPGFVRTDMTANNQTPMPFMMDAERAAEIIANGIEKRKHHIAFPFAIRLFSGAMGLVPRWMWRAVFKKLVQSQHTS